MYYSMPQRLAELTGLRTYGLPDSGAPSVPGGHRRCHNAETFFS